MRRLLWWFSGVGLVAAALFTVSSSRARCAHLAGLRSRRRRFPLLKLAPARPGGSGGLHDSPRSFPVVDESGSPEVTTDPPPFAESDQRPAKKPAKKPLKRPAQEKPVKKSPKKPVKNPAKKPVKKSPKRPVRKNPVKKSVKGASAPRVAGRTG